LSHNPEASNEKSNKQTQFEAELASLLNKYSLENGSNTPDFLLAEFLTQCLAAWDICNAKREAWYGR
jgi:hypothetical protein